MVRLLSRHLKCSLATSIWHICGHVCIIILLCTVALALRKLLCVGMAMLGACARALARRIVAVSERVDAVMISKEMHKATCSLGMLRVL